jgi:uncharacterized protein (TIGR02996 family)
MATEDDLQGLFSQIKEDQENSVVKLVYSDALEECGRIDEAKLIRVQYELKKNNNGRVYCKDIDSSCIDCQLLQDEQELSWSMPAEDWIHHQRTCGLVDLVVCSFDQWRENGKRWVSLYPIKRVMIAGQRPSGSCWRKIDSNGYGVPLEFWSDRLVGLFSSIREAEDAISRHLIEWANRWHNETKRQFWR